MLFDTPLVVVDRAVMESNIERFQRSASKAGVGFRPHIKTHKSTEVARMQIKAGAVGLTCATLAEAVGLSEAGVGNDVFVAVPHYPSSMKFERIEELLAAGCTLSLSVDDAGVAELLADRYGAELGLLVEIDSGLGRTGVTPAASVAVARACGEALWGVFTHGGHGYPPGAAPSAGADEVRLLGEAGALIEAAGMTIRVVSAGSTPTFPYCLAEPVNEVRPGTYVFGDWQQVCNRSMGLSDVAARVVSTVISAPAPGRFVLDAGAKILTKDQAPWVVGFGHIPSMPDAIIRRIYDNQAVVDTDGENPPVGTQLEIVPNHICPVINLVDEIWMADGTRLPVDLRGHLD